MKFVAFFRNVNLGRPKSPTRAQLESAFLEAGAETAASFQTNGTLVFTADERAAADRIAQRAAALLVERSGTREPVFVRELDRLAALVTEDPFAEFEDVPLGARDITFFDRPDGATVDAPLESPRKDCLIFRIDAGEAFSVGHWVAGRYGAPGPLLQAAFKTPASNRTWGTILRMVAKHGAGSPARAEE